jgi:DNA invertase Pin-like site-specific DNA recombinase
MSNLHQPPFKQIVRPKAVAYHRVSTEKQGRSGLGLEAQQATLNAFVAANSMVVVEQFVEVESGKKADRPELAKALAACRLHRAVLVVAKLDRLARNAHFLLGLQDAGVDFIACDIPAANRLTVGIMAMVAEEEARLISERTKAALAAAKARGAILGNPGNLTKAARLTGASLSSQARHKKALERVADLTPIIQDLRSQGVSSLRGLARELNERGIPSPRGGLWHASQIRNAVTTSGTQL